MASQRISKLNESNRPSENPKVNPILKAMGEEFGYTATHAILSHISRNSMKSMAEILSDYETFSRILKEVYTAGVAEKEILGRLSSYRLREKI